MKGPNISISQRKSPTHHPPPTPTTCQHRFIVNSANVATCQICQVVRDCGAPSLRIGAWGPYHERKKQGSHHSRGVGKGFRSDLVATRATVAVGAGEESPSEYGTSSGLSDGTVDESGGFEGGETDDGHD